MNTRQHWILGMAALGLLVSLPVQATPDDMRGTLIVAERDPANEARPDLRTQRQDAPRDPHDDAKREPPRGYGYGYERRQQQQRNERNEQDRRPRDRR